MANLDTLEIEIKEVGGKSKGIDNLKENLTSLKSALESIGKVKTSSITRISTAINNLVQSGNSGGLQKVVDNLNKLGSMDTSGMEKVRKEINKTANAIDKLTLAQGMNGAGVALDLSGAKKTEAEAPTGDGVEKLSKVGSLVETWKNIKEKIKESTKGLSQFFASIKRIAMYRAIRSLISSITNGMKEGVNNAYQWSKAMGGAFADKMDGLATSFLQLKNSLGAMAMPIINVLAPHIESLTNKVIALSNVLNQLFAKLSGASTWTKAVRSQTEYAKATEAGAKATKNLLGGFDEINNIGGGSTASNSGGTDFSGMFETVDLEQDKTWLNVIADLMDEIVAGAIGLWGALKLIKLGLDPIKSMGIGLAIMGIVIAVHSLIEYLDDPSWKNFGGILEGIGLALLGLALVFGSVPLAIAGAVVLALGFVAQFHDQVMEFFDKIEGGLDNAIQWVNDNITNRFGIIGNFIGSFLTNGLSAIKLTITTVKTLLDGLLRGVKLIIDGIIQMFKGDLKGGLKTAFEGIKTITKSIFDSIWGIVKGVLNSIVTGIEKAINAGINGLNKLTSGIRSLGNKALSLLGFDFRIPELSTISLPRLATGTNEVPQDMVAMIHKGEAVVPKEFNDREFFGGNDEETNSILRDILVALNNKDFNPTISVDEIGKASVKYINKKQRQLGGALI